MSQSGGEGILHQQLLVVTGLFAGFSITALVAMLQSSDSFRAQIWPAYADAYFVLLVTILALVSLDLILCSFGLSMAAAGLDPQGVLWGFNSVTLFAGLIGLLLFIPLVLLPVSLVSALTVSVFEVLVLAWFSSRASKVPMGSPFRAPKG
jgi:hypothetical protein